MDAEILGALVYVLLAGAIIVYGIKRYREWKSEDFEKRDN